MLIRKEVQEVTGVVTIPMHSHEMDQKLHEIVKEIKQTDDWQTKIKLSIPLINLLGVSFEHEFKLNDFIRKSVRKSNQHI